MAEATKTDVIDIIIPSYRGAQAIQKILKESANEPETWQHHHFIVVFDNLENRQELRSWLAEMLDILPLPHVTTCVAKPGIHRNVAALRQQGLEQGVRPYIYFQDDDDPLPKGLEQRIDMIKNHGWDAVYGVTHTQDTREHVIETFPTLVNGAFAFDPADAARLFPTYFHPMAALFRRDLFKQMPLDDGKIYENTGCCAFIAKLFASGRSVTFLTDTIRIVRHHKENDTGILTKKQADAFAHDIMKWLEDLPENETKEFQKMIARELLSGDITTFREISALVELTLETKA